MDMLKAMVGWVWRVQTRPSLIILAGVCAFFLLYEAANKHTAVIAIALLVLLAGGVALVCCLGRAPSDDN